MDSGVENSEQGLRPTVHGFPTLHEQRLQLQKQRCLDHSTGTLRLPLHLRPLLAMQAWVTYVLLRTGINSRVVTLAWFLVALVAYAIIALGAPWSFVAGAGLVYVKIMLDLTDGELGRYQKRFMSPEQDLATHMQGIYLDRVCHIVENPLWGLALGCGAYQLTGNLWMVLCGVSVAVFRTFARFDGLLQEHIVLQFRERIAAAAHDGIVNQSADAARRHGHILRGVYAKLVFWLKNGKRFNHLIFVFGTIDWICSAAFGAALAVQAFLLFAGVVCLLAMVVRISSVQFSNFLFDRARQTLAACEVFDAKAESDQD